MNKETRLDHIILLRAAATTLVVLGHCLKNSNAPHQYMYNPAYTSFWEVGLIHYISSFHMPLFFWISGYVFYFSSAQKVDHVNITGELYKKIKRLIVPLFATSLFILFPTIMIFGYPTNDFMVMLQSFLLVRDVGHLWFLKSLFYIFILVIPFCNNLKKLNFYQSLLLPVLLIIISLNISKTPQFIDALLKYLPLFLLGYLTRKHDHLFVKGHTLMNFALFFTVHFVLFICGEMGAVTGQWYRFVWYCKALLGTYFMYFTAVLLINYNCLNKLWKQVVLIDTRSYTIYLFHITFIYMVHKLFSFSPDHNVLVRIIPSFVLGMLLPLPIHLLLSKNSFTAFMFSIPYSGKSTS